MRARVEMSPRAVQQAPFRVLVGANMPAVLVEIGYLSNPDQEQALASGPYQDRSRRRSSMRSRSSAISSSAPPASRRRRLDHRNEPQRALRQSAIGLAAVGLGWALMTALSRVLRRRRSGAPADDAPQQHRRRPPTPAVPRIKATLFFASADGRRSCRGTGDPARTRHRGAGPRARRGATDGGRPRRAGHRRSRKAPSSSASTSPSATKRLSISTAPCATSILAAR